MLLYPASPGTQLSSPFMFHLSPSAQPCGTFRSPLNCSSTLKPWASTCHPLPSLSPASLRLVQAQALRTASDDHHIYRTTSSAIVSFQCWTLFCYISLPCILFISWILPPMLVWRQTPLWPADRTKPHSVDIDEYLDFWTLNLCPSPWHYSWLPNSVKSAQDQWGQQWMSPWLERK